jgi:hypothetical protein
MSLDFDGAGGQQAEIEGRALSISVRLASA